MPSQRHRCPCTQPSGGLSSSGDGKAQHGVQPRAGPQMREGEATGTWFPIGSQCLLCQEPARDSKKQALWVPGSEGTFSPRRAFLSCSLTCTGQSQKGSKAVQPTKDPEAWDQAGGSVNHTSAWPLPAAPSTGLWGRKGSGETLGEGFLHLSHRGTGGTAPATLHLSPKGWDPALHVIFGPKGCCPGNLLLLLGGACRTVTSMATRKL